MDKVNRFLRYLYDPEPMNDSPDAIVCLAQTYTNDPVVDNGVANDQWPSEFLKDHEARLWFTYRTGFEKIMRDTNDQSLAVKFGSDGFTADTGFGCMIRSAQTLLANAILTLKLGRDWRVGERRSEEAEIIRMFADDVVAPFSIHRFISYGAQACDKPAGQWFGPNAASLCISALSAEYPECGLRVYVASEQGGTLYEDSALDIARAGDTFVPLLILVPQRLGHEKINPIYYDALRSLFHVPQFMGIAGGRPSSAHYFFARQDNRLFFLDPHFPRTSLPYHEDLNQYTEEDIDGTHTSRVRAMAMADLDPSMLLGFLVRDEAEWKLWKSTIDAQPGKMKLVTIAENRPAFGRHDSDQLDRESDVMSEEEGLQ